MPKIWSRKRCCMPTAAFAPLLPAPTSRRGCTGFCITPGSLPTANNGADPRRSPLISSATISVFVTRPPRRSGCTRRKLKRLKPSRTSKSRRHCCRCPRRTGWPSTPPTSRAAHMPRSPPSWALPRARWCRGCTEDARDCANCFLYSPPNVESLTEKLRRRQLWRHRSPTPTTRTRSLCRGYLSKEVDESDSLQMLDKPEGLAISEVPGRKRDRVNVRGHCSTTPPSVGVRHAHRLGLRSRRHKERYAMLAAFGFEALGVVVGDMYF